MQLPKVLVNDIHSAHVRIRSVSAGDGSYIPIACGMVSGTARRRESSTRAPRAGHRGSCCLPRSLCSAINAHSRQSQSEVIVIIASCSRSQSAANSAAAIPQPNGGGTSNPRNWNQFVTRYDGTRIVPANDSKNCMRTCCVMPGRQRPESSMGRHCLQPSAMHAQRESRSTSTSSLVTERKRARKGPAPPVACCSRKSQFLSMPSARRIRPSRIAVAKKRLGEPGLAWKATWWKRAPESPRMHVSACSCCSIIASSTHGRGSGGSTVNICGPTRARKSGSTVPVLVASMLCHAPRLRGAWPTSTSWRPS
mmetsp:Transcript_102656/g.290311  ORF Transcript_102656/g.290311 Transcript_102656/m.290311 type:complete len:309 (-) Transcript_102656:166-1092(-)